MLESEAATKLCPFAAKFSASQQIADGPGPMCVGGKCMAWTWTQAQQSEVFRQASERRAKSMGYEHRSAEYKKDLAYRNPPPGVDYDRFDGECGMVRL